MDYEKQFRNLYRQRKIFKYNDPLALHLTCERKNLCWCENGIKRTPHGTYQSITRPYVGKYYEQTRVLVLGENHRDNTEYHSAGYLKYFSSQIKGIRNKGFYAEEYWIGMTSMFIQQTQDKKLKKRWGGTAVFTGLLTYCVKLVGTLGLVKVITGNISTSDEQCKIGDYIAWTQSVKCNPEETGDKKTKRNTPTKGMWNNCPEHILLKELDILKPKYILVLGLKNYHHIQMLLEKKIGYAQVSSHSRRKPPRVEYWSGSKLRSKIRIIGVPHPSTPGNRQVSVANKLGTLLRAI